MHRLLSTIVYYQRHNPPTASDQYQAWRVLVGIWVGPGQIPNAKWTVAFL